LNGHQQSIAVVADAQYAFERPAKAIKAQMHHCSNHLMKHQSMHILQPTNPTTNHLEGLLILLYTAEQVEERLQ
jgi:hypothetical protein